MPQTDTETLNRMIEPARHAGRAMLDSWEQLSRFQLETARRYSELLFSEWRSLLDVHDGQSFQAFVGQQQNVVREFGDALTADARRLGEMSKEWTQEMEKVSRESSEALTVVARNAEKVGSAKARTAAG